MPEDRRFELSESDANIFENLGEECTEVAKEVFKILRFSQHNTHPKYEEYENTPSKRLSLELGQMFYMISLIREKGLVDEDLFLKGFDGKKRAMQRIPYNIVKIVPKYSADFDSTQPTPDAMLNHKF